MSAEGTRTGEELQKSRRVHLVKTRHNQLRHWTMSSSRACTSRARTRTPPPGSGLATEEWLPLRRPPPHRATASAYENQGLEPTARAEQAAKTQPRVQLDANAASTSWVSKYLEENMIRPPPPPPPPDWPPEAAPPCADMIPVPDILEDRTTTEPPEPPPEAQGPALALPPGDDKEPSSTSEYRPSNCPHNQPEHGRGRNSDKG